MRRLRVVVADAAKQDLRDIAGYLAHRDSTTAARRQLARLAAQARALATNPGRGRIPPELAERGLRTWREVIIAPWRIVYRIDGSHVYVLAVLDGRRDLSELLLRRLTRP